MTTANLPHAHPLATNPPESPEGPSAYALTVTGRHRWAAVAALAYLGNVSTRAAHAGFAELAPDADRLAVTFGRVKLTGIRESRDPAARELARAALALDFFRNRASFPDGREWDPGANQFGAYVPRYAGDACAAYYAAAVEYFADAHGGDPSEARGSVLALAFGVAPFLPERAAALLAGWAVTVAGRDTRRAREQVRRMTTGPEAAMPYGVAGLAAELAGFSLASAAHMDRVHALDDCRRAFAPGRPVTVMQFAKGRSIVLQFDPEHGRTYNLSRTVAIALGDSFGEGYGGRWYVKARPSEILHGLAWRLYMDSTGDACPGALDT